MNDKICSMDGCEKPVKGRGWCSMHYGRWDRHGSPYIALTTHQEGCSVKGCEGKHHSKGYCSPHYLRWRRHGRAEIRTCAISGCADKHQARGWCVKHYNRWKRTGSPLVGGRGGSADLDATPLLDFIEAHGGLTECLDRADLHGQARDTVRTSMKRAAETGEVAVHAADQAAIRLFNLHPCEIYGDDWWVGPEELELAA